MHTSLLCFDRPNKPLTKKKLLSRVGPVTAKWIETRHEWIQRNSTPTGTWQCYYCPQLLAIEADPDRYIQLLTLDHKLSRARHPEFRFVLSNLVPACAKHNSEKGSRSEEEYTLWLKQNLAA